MVRLFSIPRLPGAPPHLRPPKIVAIAHTLCKQPTLSGSSPLPGSTRKESKVPTLCPSRLGESETQGRSIALGGLLNNASTAASNVKRDAPQAQSNTLPLFCVHFRTTLWHAHVPRRPRPRAGPDFVRSHMLPLGWRHALNTQTLLPKLGDAS